MPADIFSKDMPKHPNRFGRIMKPDKEWLTKQPREEALAPELVIVDPHHHLWDYPKYRYLVPEIAADLDCGHHIAAAIYAECGSMFRADGPERLRPIGETEFALGQGAQSRSGQFGSTRVAEKIIGFADFNLGEAVEEVLHAQIAAGNGRFCGIRLETNWDADPEITDSPFPGYQRPHVLPEKPIRAGLKKLAKLGLVCDSWIFFTQLDEVCELAELTIISDHCCGPLGYGVYATNKDEHYRTWRAGMEKVAERPNVLCKLGGVLGRGAAYDYLHAPTPPTSDELVAAWEGWVVPCIEAFGVERCMFESNYPLEKMGTNLTILWNTFKKLAYGCSADEQQALFSGTAARTYGIDLLAIKVQVDTASFSRPKPGQVDELEA